MCGPSSQQQMLAGQSQSMASEFQANFRKQFENQSSILASLNNALSPMVAAGPNQHGFSPDELAALNTKIINTGGAAARNAAQATGTALAGRGGGGDSGLESGVDQQIKATIASKAAGDIANAQNNVQLQDFETGRQNFFNAVSGQKALAGLYDPTAYGSLGLKGNETAFGEATKVQDMKNQKEAAIAGGITSLATGALTFGMGAVQGGGLLGGFQALAGQNVGDS